jgi:hypothetical protein
MSGGDCFILLHIEQIQTNFLISPLEIRYDNSTLKFCYNVTICDNF